MIRAVIRRLNVTNRYQPAPNATLPAGDTRWKLLNWWPLKLEVVESEWCTGQDLNLQPPDPKAAGYPLTSSAFAIILYSDWPLIRLMIRS